MYACSRKRFIEFCYAKHIDKIQNAIFQTPSNKDTCILTFISDPVHFNYITPGSRFLKVKRKVRTLR